MTLKKKKKVFQPWFKEIIFCKFSDHIGTFCRKKLSRL